MNEMTCPFCLEGGMDDVGLKAHLFQWCEAFDATPAPHHDDDNIEARAARDAKYRPPDRTSACKGCGQ